MTGQTISHYRIVEKLGEGGMGVVYKAEDLKLGRAVALKFLPPHLLDSEEHKARFLHEARAAALLDHPNICTVYEIDEADGQTFLAMACLGGKTLKQKIAERPLPLQEALDIATQIGQGLQAAHEKGIVHRDIKPANIMITPQGQVKIMDFGLAQLSDRTKLTATGSKLGTPAYMSPEQTEGKPADRRSDIWALGVVLYEMISGRVPFPGEAEAAVAYAIVHTEPEPLSALRTGVPLELDRIVSKLLDKNREDRYHHVDEAMVDLRKIRQGLVVKSGKVSYPRRYAIATGACAIFLAGVAWVWVGSRTNMDESAIRSLAVLPLRPLSANADDYLGVGIADAVISKIGATGFVVRPISAVRKYASDGADTGAAAKELQVEAVLEGSYQRDGERLRVSVMLIRAADGSPVWSHTFQVAMTDVFAVQDELARQMASHLSLRLTSGQQARMKRRTTSSPEAYEQYLLGMKQFDQRTPSRGLELTAIDHFRRAIAIDPNYAQASARLANTYTWNALFGEPDNPEWIALARDELKRAQHLDPELPEARVTKFEILWSAHGGWQLEAAVRELEAAQKIDPLVGHAETATLFAHMGLEEQSRRSYARAMEIDPLNGYTRERSIETLSFLGRDEESIRENLRLNNRPGPSWALVGTGNVAEARPLIEQEMKNAPNSAHVLGRYAALLALEGRFREAEAVVPKIAATPQDRSHHHGTFGAALVYALQGNSKEAVYWLRQTADTGMPNYLLFSRNRHLKRIQDNSEFREFMVEMKRRWEGFQAEFP